MKTESVPPNTFDGKIVLKSPVETPDANIDPVQVRVDEAIESIVALWGSNEDSEDSSQIDNDIDLDLALSRFSEVCKDLESCIKAEESDVAASTIPPTLKFLVRHVEQILRIFSKLLLFHGYKDIIEASARLRVIGRLSSILLFCSREIPSFGSSISEASGLQLLLWLNRDFSLSGASLEQLHNISAELLHYRSVLSNLHSGKAVLFKREDVAVSDELALSLNMDQEYTLEMADEYIMRLADEYANRKHFVPAVDLLFDVKAHTRLIDWKLTLTDALNTLGYLEGLIPFVAESHGQSDMRKFIASLYFLAGDFVQAIIAAFSSKDLRFALLILRRALDFKNTKTLVATIEEINAIASDGLPSIQFTTPESWSSKILNSAGFVSPFSEWDLHDDTTILLNERTYLKDTTRHAIAKQLLWTVVMLGEHGRLIGFLESNSAKLVTDVEVCDPAMTVLRCENMSTLLRTCGEALGMTEARAAADAYEKGNVRADVKGGSSWKLIDNTKVQVANLYATGFINCGYGSDKLLSATSSGEDPVNNDVFKKIKGPSFVAAPLSIALTCLWNVDEGLEKIDRYQWSSEPFLQAGAFLAFGTNSSTIFAEGDPSEALLKEELNIPVEAGAIGMPGETNSAIDTPMAEVSSVLTEQPAPTAPESSEDVATTLSIAAPPANRPKSAVGPVLAPPVTSEVARSACAALGMGVAYAGMPKTECLESLIALAISDDITVSTYAALALGLMYSGTGDQQVSQILSGVLLDKLSKSVSASQTPEIQPHLLVAFSLSLACIFMRVGRMPEEITDIFQGETHYFARITTSLVEAAALAGCNHAGSAKVVMQRILDCEVAISTAREKAAVKQSDMDNTDESVWAPFVVEQATKETELMVNVLCLSLLCIPNSGSDSSGQTMCYRLFSHLLQIASTPIRRSVPLGLALLYPSEPNPSVLNVLGRLTNDPDATVALNSILALGIVAAGTNNAKAAQQLFRSRELYSSEAHAAFLFAVSQSLVHLGKGSLSLSPIVAEKRYIKVSALSGLLCFCTLSMQPRATLLDSFNHVLLTLLTPAIRPRFVAFLDHADGTIFKLNAKVGQGVDVSVNPTSSRKLSGFEFQDNPILLCTNAGERVEIVQPESGEIKVFSSCMDGVVFAQLVPKA